MLYLNDKGKEELISELSRILDQLQKNYNLKPTDALNLAEPKTDIPLSVFTTTRGPLESLVIYLHVTIGLDFKSIAELLQRDYQTVWTSFKLGCEKQAIPHSSVISKEVLQNISLSSVDDIRVPLALFSTRKLSISESLVTHLHKAHRLSYKDIGLLLNRDQRTIWTMHSRAQKKVNTNETK